MEERVQKLLSSAGVLSRRAAEEYIRQGRITVNGAVAQLGDCADAQRDVLAVDGVPIAADHRRVYLMLNKPRGYVTTLQDERGRKTVAELVEDCGVRVWPVGRLDLYSEGLLLMTNDGDFTNRLLHPSHEVEKEYLVRVSQCTSGQLARLREPFVLDGKQLSPARVELLSRGEDSALLKIVIHEGKNRQVRRMCAMVGCRVLRLKRVREGKLVLGDLKSGAWRELKKDEVDAFLST